MRGFGTAVGQTIAFIIQHKEQILLLGAGVALLTGHWIAAAGALAAYIGLSSQYRGDLGALNALNEKELALQQQILAVEEARAKGQRSGGTSDAVLDRMRQQQAAIVKEKEALFDILRRDNDRPQPKIDIPGLSPALDTKALKERTQFIEELQKKIQDLQNTIANPLGDANVKMLQDFDELAAKAAKFTDPVVRRLTEELLRLTHVVIDKNKADAADKALIEQITQAEVAREAVEARARQFHQEDLDYLTKKLALDQRDRDFQLQKLQASGAPENVVLAERIRLLNEQRKALETPGAPRVAGDLTAINQQIELSEIQIEQLRKAAEDAGKVTINVGKAVADTLADMATGLAQGTLKGLDVLKLAGSSALNFVTDIFRQTLQKKLSFEVDLFQNLRQLPAQANSNLAAGAASLPGGRLFQSIFGGGGNQTFTSAGGLQSFFPFDGGGTGTSPDFSPDRRLRPLFVA